VKTEEKVVEYLSLFLPCCNLFSSLACHRAYSFFDLPILADIPVEALLLILCILCDVQLQLLVGLPDPISVQLGSVPILFSD